MKRFFLFMISLVIVAIAKAQPEVGTLSVIPKLGVSIANLSDTRLQINQTSFGKGKYTAGFNGGFDLQYQVTNGFAVSLGASYSQQGSKYNDYENMSQKSTSEKETKNYEGYSNVRYDLSYIHVPLMAHLYSAQNFSVNVGIQLGILTSANLKYEHSYYEEVKNIETGETSREKEEQGKDVKISVKEQFKKTDVSIPIGVSYEYENVVLDARYDIPLTKSFGDSRNKVVEVTAGYKFSL